MDLQSLNSVSRLPLIPILYTVVVKNHYTSRFQGSYFERLYFYTLPLVVINFPSLPLPSLFIQVKFVLLF